MRFALGRLARLAVVTFTVAAATFFMANLLPGDPAVAILGIEAPASAVAAVRAELGLDDPLPARFVAWMGDALRGDLGRSFQSGEPVTRIIRQRAPVSLQIMVVTQVLALALSIPLALAAAYRPGRILDRVAGGLSFLFLSTPHFVLAIVLILLFAVQFGVLPASGWTPITDSVVGNARSLALPVTVLALSLVPLYFPVLRAELLQVLREDYILLARAEGLPPSRIMLRHALRPAILPFMTLVGIHVGGLIGGAVIVEHVFGMPGLGSLLINSIAQRDFPVLQGAVLVGAVGYVVANFTVDMLYAVADPRIRHGRG